MSVDLYSLVQLILIASFVFGGVNYTIVQPFNAAITRLSNTIAKFERAVESLERNQHETEKRVAILEQSAKSAHRRIDELKEEANKNK